MREFSFVLVGTLAVLTASSLAAATAPQGDRQTLPVVFDAPRNWKQMPVLVSSSHVVAQWADPAAKPSLLKYVSDKGEQSEFEQAIPSTLQVLCFPMQPESNLWDTRFPRYEVYAHRMGLATEGATVSAAAAGAGQLKGKTYRYDPEEGAGSIPRILARAVQVGGLEVVFQFSFADINAEQVEPAFDRLVNSIQPAGSTRSGPAIAGRRPGFIDEPPVAVGGEMMVKIFEAQNRSTSEWLKASCLPGWKCVEERGIWLQFEGDPAQPRKAAVAVLQVFDWLERQFGGHVRNKYCHRPVLVIMPDDPLHESVFMRVINSPYRPTPEWVLTTTAKSDPDGFAYSPLSVPLVESWFSERDADLWIMLPFWLSNGTEQLVHGMLDGSSGSAKRPRPSYHIEDVREQMQRGRSPDLKALFEAHDDNVLGRGLSIDFEVRNRAIAVAQLLMGPEIQKSRRFGGLVRTYLTNLAAAIEPVRSQVDAVHEQEYGELALRSPAVAERRLLWAAHAKSVRKAAFDATFKDWSARDWAELDKYFRESF